MDLTTKESLEASDKAQLMALWNAVYPSNLYYNDLENLEQYLNGLSMLQHYLMVDDANKIIAWAFSFQREADNWFAILIDKAYQKKGLGRHLLNLLKKNQTKLNGWVIDKDNYSLKNGENYLSPLPFYLKNNFVICEHIRLETDKISAVKIEWSATN